jgi:hypothetical protein
MNLSGRYGHKETRKLLFQKCYGSLLALLKPSFGGDSCHGALLQGLAWNKVEADLIKFFR